MRRKRRAFSYFIRLVAIGLVAVAVYEEMRKPAEKREWHGKIANFIPYDFRVPTIKRLRSKLWNPDDRRIFTEHVFGVGWAINFYSLLRRPQRQQQEPSTPPAGDSA